VEVHGGHIQSHLVVLVDSLHDDSYLANEIVDDHERFAHLEAE
jgi:hypothetical protein